MNEENVAVKRGGGALMGGWVCLLLGLGLAVAPVPTFFLWVPFLLVAFILAIVAMAQNRVAGGLVILIGVVIGGPVCWVVGWILLLGIVHGVNEERANAMERERVAVSVAAAEKRQADWDRHKAAETNAEETNAVANFPALPAQTSEPDWAVKAREAEAAKAAAKARDGESLLKFHQDLAEKGDAYGQFKMGMRYLSGDGVAADPQKARALLAKAATLGSQEAKDELAKLPPPDTAK